MDPTGEFAMAVPFIIGIEEIDRNLLSKGDNRFGGQFYVASDKMTADLERPGPGTYVKLVFLLMPEY